MIDKFVTFFTDNKDLLASRFAKPPEEYKDVVIAVFDLLLGEGGYKLTETDTGSGFEGSFLYVIVAPSETYYVRVGYGSCCVCDTMEYIKRLPEEDRTRAYITLALHIVQKIRTLDEEVVENPF